MAAAIQDSFTAPANATLECGPYRITLAGVAQNLVGWRIIGQWRYADGTLALDLRVENGLIVVTDAANGLFIQRVQPGDLATLVPGAIAYDILAIPPLGADGVPRIYRVVEGVATIAAGSTHAR